DGTILDVILANTAATVSGTGTVRSFLGGASGPVGTINPGQNGTQATRFGNLTTNGPSTLGASTSFFVDLDDDAAGAGVGYDQLVIGAGGMLNLNGAVLTGLATSKVLQGDTFTIIKATGGGIITGKFAEAFDPNEVYISGQKFLVTYNTGSNGSVVLTR